MSYLGVDTSVCGGRHKERVYKSEHGRNTKYSCIKMKKMRPIESKIK
jgi:hypothetical protein